MTNLKKRIIPLTVDIQTCPFHTHIDLGVEVEMPQMPPFIQMMLGMNPEEDPVQVIEIASLTLSHN